MLVEYKVSTEVESMLGIWENKNYNIHNYN